MYLQEWDPGEVLDEGIEDAPLAKAILEERETDVTRAREDDCAGKPDLETVQVETVNRETPPEQEVVQGRQDGSSGQTVCGNCQRMMFHARYCDAHSRRTCTPAC